MTDPRTAPEWEEVKDKIFFRDGSLRDIYVLNTGPADWERFLQALPESPWTTSYSWEGTSQALPRTFEGASSREGKALLSIGQDGLYLNCHFFTDTEIELDLEPDAVDSPQKFERLTGFMQWLADLLNKPVVLTPENSSDEALIEVAPAGIGS